MKRSNLNRSKAALILLGGRSKRMKPVLDDESVGSKTELRLPGGERFVDFWIRLCQENGLDCFLSLRKSQAKDFPLQASIYDQMEDQGPMAALHAAHESRPATDFMIVAADLYARSSDLQKLIGIFQKDIPAFTISRDARSERLQPLLAIWPAEQLGILAKAFDQGQRSISLHLQSLEADQDFQILNFEKGIWNVNNPEDYADLLKEYKSEL